MLADLPLGVVEVESGIVCSANRAALELLGCSEGALLGRRLDEFAASPREATPAPEGEAVSDSATSPGRSSELPTRLRGRDGITLALRSVEVDPGAAPGARGDAGERHVVCLRSEPPTGRLVAGLSSVALKLQRGRSADEVLRLAVAGLRELDLNTIVGRLEDDRLVMEHIGMSPAAVQDTEAVLGVPLHQLSARLPLLEISQTVLREMRPVFPADLTPSIARVARSHGIGLTDSEIEARLSPHGQTRTALCPLFAHGRPWGILAVGAEGLEAADAAALRLFSLQLASAVENAQTIERLERRNRELAAVEAIANAAAETRLERLLPELLRIAAAATASDAGVMYLVDEERRELALVADHGFSEPLPAIFHRGRLPGTPPGSGHLADEPPVVELELKAFSREEAHPLAVDLLAREELRWLAEVPLRGKNRPAGLLMLMRRKDRFGPAELSTADLLRGQIGLQVESARLYAELRRRMRLLSFLFDLSRIGSETLDVATLAQRLLGRLADTLTIDGAALYLLDGDNLALAGRHGAGDISHADRLPVDQRSAAGRAVLRRDWESETWPAPQGESRADAAPSPDRARSVAAVPLVSKERLIGALTVARADGLGFDKEARRLLESCAAQAAAAIEHARLFEEERSRGEELGLFLEFGRLITGSLDLEAVLVEAASSIARIAEANEAFVYLLDAGCLRGFSTSTPERREGFKNERISIDDTGSRAVEALRSRAPVLVEDVEHHSPRRLFHHYRLRSLLALPLLVRDTPIGVVVVGDTRGTRQWTDVQVQRATVLARQIAVAISNARLYEDLKHSYEQLAIAQAQLVERERLVALGELAAVVAHEVRNPLGVIFNSLQALRRIVRGNPQAAMLLDIVGEEADRLNRIVGDLLDFARPNEPALRPSVLAQTIEDACASVQPLADASGVRLSCSADRDLPTVPLDERMARQAIVNLVVNGLQATPRGGEVTVTGGLEPAAEGRPACARIDVVDSGPGVRPELAEKIFQPFFTTKASGTGLGLAVVKRIANVHGGEVFVETDPPRGARFVLRLPLTGSR